MADASIPNLFNRCKTCRFWASDLSDFDNIAECRRNPPERTDGLIRGAREPSRIGYDVEGRGRWPLLNQADWCGEHEARG